MSVLLAFQKNKRTPKEQTFILQYYSESVLHHYKIEWNCTALTLTVKLRLLHGPKYANDVPYRTKF